MSLIEKAVSKLTNVSADAIALPDAETFRAAVPQGDKRATAIERLGDGGNKEALSRQSGSSDQGSSYRPNLARSTKLDEVSKREVIRIHLESLRARGFVTPDGNQTQISQEFRVIKRPLLANAFGRGVSAVKNGKRIMVTSAFPGEGKSFCAINLAMSIAAERDNKVLLVDADVARPSIPKELGITVEAGLMDWLIDGNLDISQVVLPTNVDKLMILPAGRRHQQATELLASASMSRLLELITARYPDRVVIFDSPPLLVTTESRVLSSYMGQVVLVVESGKTSHESVQEALATIGASEVVGLVLNKARATEQGYYGGYGGYGYGV
jgi:protein-tyrosine kinase